MFNSKPLWWTLLTGWIMVASYWHICRIKQLCDTIATPGLSYSTSPVGSFNFSNRFEILQFEIDIEQLTQYLIMIVVTMLLGFLTGNSYKSKKHQELHYKLNRLNKELDYYRSKQ